MRLIQNYRFDIRTKLPYAQWPEIVHRFLSENHLVSHRFLYYFDEFAKELPTQEEILRKSSCIKILKDCPSLGEVRYYHGKAYHRSEELFLSNIDGQENFPESKLLPLMNKIHRRYGFASCKLFYFDIDFFGNRTYFQRDYSMATRTCQAASIPFDPTLHMEYQPYGSGIVLHRDICGDNYLLLSIDLLHNGIVMDPTPYRETMQRLLPNIKVTTFQKIYLTEEEQQEIGDINRHAAPVLKQCCQFLGERLPFVKGQNRFPSNYSVATPLKKLAKQYGYQYKLLWNGGVYALEKRTPRGNVLYIVADSGPSHYDLGVDVVFQGVGFKHTLGNSNQTPTNQQEADAFLEKVISEIAAFENTLLPSLDCLFPETPDWFIPSE